MREDARAGRQRAGLVVSGVGRAPEVDTAGEGQGPLTARWRAGMGRFTVSGGTSGVDPVRALEVRLAEVQQQFRATSDILKVLTSGASEQTRVFDAVVDNARRLLDAQVA